MVYYGVLFAVSAATLRTIAAEERHLGAEIGFLSVLHTWSQDLRHHPHVHGVDRPRTMRLSGVEFLRRFLLHVLPRGFPRIRHYGLLGNRKRAAKLAECRLLLGAPMPAPPTPLVEPCAVTDDRCPACRSGRLVRRPLSLAKLPELADSS